LPCHQRHLAEKTQYLLLLLPYPGYSNIGFGMQELRATMWEQGPIKVDNGESDAHTVVTVTVPKQKSTALLEIASTVTGVGFRIHEAVIQV
jgi:hypothetical protein